MNIITDNFSFCHSILFITFGLAAAAVIVTALMFDKSGQRQRDKSILGGKIACVKNLLTV
jgi:hypothetical protein